jgi:hypothetical protein
MAKHTRRPPNTTRRLALASHACVFLMSGIAACGGGGGGTGSGDDTGTTTTEATGTTLAVDTSATAGIELDALPRPQGTDGTLDETFELTPEKVDLGRFLFGDPALVTHVVTREENAACSGNLELLQGGSCIACHAPAAGGGKAGQEIGISVGGTADGLPYLRVFLSAGVLLPGNGMPITLRLVRAAVDEPVTGYTLSLLSGQGDPSQFASDGSPG